MAANKVFRFGPVAMSATLTTNILNCTISSFSGSTGVTVTGLYMIIRHIRIVNKTAAAVTFTLYIDSTGGNTAGKEFIGTALSVPSYSAYDWYGMVRLDAADFLVGGASAATSMSIQGEGEIGVL